MTLTPPHIIGSQVDILKLPASYTAPRLSFQSQLPTPQAEDVKDRLTQAQLYSQRRVLVAPQ
jgi:hypothetical protein